MGSSATATTRRATSSQGAASAGRDCGARGVSGTASALTGSATQPTGRARARRGTVGSSAGSRVLLGIMDKTAGTGGILFFYKWVFHTNRCFPTLQMAKHENRNKAVMTSPIDV